MSELLTQIFSESIALIYNISKSIFELLHSITKCISKKYCVRLYIYNTNTENIEQFKNVRYWIALPDTIKFGEKFFDSMLNYYQSKLINSNKLQSIPLIGLDYRPTMDMGIVHSDHIIHMTDYLQRIKTYETNFSVLKLLKKQLIYDENTILGTLSGFKERTKHNCKLLDYSQFEYMITDQNCVQETLLEGGKINQVYLSSIDLYKYQRNFISADVDLILTL